RPPALLPARGLALGALGRGARQHPVLRGDPALSAAVEERRHFLLHRGSADHARVPDLDQRRPLGVFAEVGRDEHAPHLVRGAPVFAHGHSATFSGTRSSISAPFDTTTMPESVTVKRSRSSSRSWPIVVYGGIFTPLSMMQRRIFEWRPTSTPSIRIDSSTSVYEWMRTRGCSTERLIVPPEMITPSDTIESVAMPMRCVCASAKTNFAGGRCSGAEMIGHCGL